MATWLRGNHDEGEEPINDWMQRRTDKVARLIDPKTEYPGRYRNYYWMPQHVGEILGSTLASLGVPMLDTDPGDEAAR
jgi:hypothetical protein